MALLRATTLAIMCFLLACPPRGGGQLLEDGLNVPLLPDGSPAAEPCPQNAKDVMRALGLRNPRGGALAEIDANQPHREPLTVFARPVESFLMERLGPIGTGSRFYGRIWISKRGAVVIRYYHVQMPDGEPLPICAVARRDANEMIGKPGAYPGSVELEGSTAWIFIVDDFR